MRERYFADFGSIRNIKKFFMDFLDNREDKIEFIKSIRYKRKVPELPPFRHNDNCKTIDEIFNSFKERLKGKQIIFQEIEDVKKFVEKNKVQLIDYALPICYNKNTYWECYRLDYYRKGLGFCHIGDKCPLRQDDGKLNKFFKKTIDTIYDWQSKYVHEGRRPPITEGLPLSDIYNDEQIIVLLTTNKLSQIFNRMLSKYFDQYRKN